jgi:F-type H+-transporting ATPase subunit b
MKLVRSTAVRTLLLALLLGGAAQAWQAESRPAATAPPVAADQKPPAEATAQEGQRSSGEQLAEASKEAEEGAQFKHSPIVKKIAKFLHIPVAAEYWILYGLDFGIIVAAVVWMMKKNLPGLFRTRNEAIRRSIEEAARVSAEARAKLNEIETRMANLDAEIAQMRSAAEADSRQEEARIVAAAEDDKQRIIATAEQEIAAASKLAQRELKAYAASLAIDLAERRVKVDAETDRALVRNFAQNFGKDGQ